MSGLLEADIDLGLESGAAAFDPLYTAFSLPPPPPSALSPPGRLVSTTSSGYTSLARRSKFTSVSDVSPRPITDSSFSSRSRGSLERPALCLLLPRLPVGAHTPPGRHPTSLALPHFRASLSLSPLVDPWRSVLFGPVYPMSFSLAESRDSAVSSPLSRRERATLLILLLLSFRLRRARPPPFSSEFVSRGVEDRSPYLPRFAASTPLIPGFRQRLRVQSTRPSARRYEFHS